LWRPLLREILEMSDKRKKFDKIKAIKKSGRMTKIAGRGGTHTNKKDKRVRKKSTNEYLDDLEDEEKEEDDG